MPEVLTVKGNKPKTIFSARDFEDLVRTHMGDVDVHSDVEEVLKQYGY